MLSLPLHLSRDGGGCVCESPPLRTSYLILARRGVGTEVTTDEVRGCVTTVTTRTQIQTSSPIVRQSPDFTLNTAARNVRHPELGTRGDPSLFQGLPLADRRESKCDDPLSSSHVEAHEAELHGYRD